ncbi:ras and ef-hand domain-containing protein [Anaeramoeba flamelloides]|uniref:Ras and ef-hand domain-containing protein n=1 Tax=Anaeramoeba flamelloides TaxID=1746091 RepID=A0ABQ8XX62_9EUKA|nr:ras and ef-hand domain-containing protein [Anaeramoeba flamelloides]
MESQTFKVILLGDSSVGKSSIVINFCEDTFSTSIESTIGAAYILKTINNGNKEIKLQIWDTAGQERYNSLTLLYFRSSQGAIVVYDITDKTTFERAKLWIREIREKEEQKTTIALVGNKTDLKERLVSTERGSKYAKEEDLLFFETSAKTGEGISKIFLDLIKEMPKNNVDMQKSNENYKELENDNYSMKNVDKEFVVKKNKNNSCC